MKGRCCCGSGPLLLAVLGLVAALFAGETHHFLSSSMASAVAGKRRSNRHYDSAASRPAAGAVGAHHRAWRRRLSRAAARRAALVAGLLDAIGWGPDRGFDQAMRGLLRGAFAVSRIVQSGRLDVYMTVTFIVIALALLVPMALFDEWPAWPDWPQLRFHEWAVLAIAVIGLVAVLRASNRLTAIVSLGIQGFAVALLFMLLGAPDLSFTQFMIETLSVVILALVMTRLRLSPADRRPAVRKLVDGAIATAAGARLRPAAAQGDASCRSMRR